MDAAIIFLFIGCLFILAPIIGAFLLDKRLRRLRPNSRPFGWGYYNGLGAFIAPIFVAGQLKEADANTVLFVMFIVACVFIPLGIFTLRRNRWGYVALTVVSLNPLLWIINAFYIKNRWAELDPPLATAPSPPPAPPPAYQPTQSAVLEHSVYFHLNGQVLGPYSPAQVQSLVQTGTVTRDTPSCIEGSQTWQPFHMLLSPT
jgi:hypothetical protein